MRRWLGCWGLVLGSLLAASALALGRQPGPAAPPPALARLVRLAPGRRPLGAVLRELSRQGGVPLSYSSSLVPLGHRYRVPPGPARPLGVVLREVLAAEHLQYGLLGGQLVLWPDQSPPPPGSSWIGGRASAGQSMAGVAATPASRAALPAAPGSRAKPAAAASAATFPAGAAPDRATAPGAAGRPLGFQAKELPSRPAASAAKAATVAGRSLAQPAGRPAALRPAAGAASRPARRVAQAAGGRQEPRNPVAYAAAATSAAAVASGAATPGRLPEALPLRPVALPLPALLVLPATVAAGSQPGRRLPDATPARPPLRGLYLHAEAWGSESLPLGLTGKLGVLRAYLVLGVALADGGGRQSGPALAVGVGTAGRARGRFTPSLDLLAWRIGTDHDREDTPLLLTQLRPQLAWQVRRGGRLALLAGPTLNLAAAHHRGTQTPRWDFGRDQWLWVDSTDDDSLLRLWPGVQLGLRF